MPTEGLLSEDGKEWLTRVALPYFRLAEVHIEEDAAYNKRYPVIWGVVPLSIQPTIVNHQLVVGGISIA